MDRLMFKCLKGEAKGHSKRSQSKESVGGFPSVPRRSVACPANVELKQVETVQMCSTCASKQSIIQNSPDNNSPMPRRKSVTAYRTTAASQLDHGQTDTLTSGGIDVDRVRTRTLEEHSPNADTLTSTFNPDSN
ncbi:uncharacterized protein LOC142339259 [Convolutriloba macropyga]|uniref:uncharacterized protein LOC142339259 n=1 Tax=Convolutriloba macropyga TaxID=536237 RepID=UPI003F528DB4